MRVLAAVCFSLAAAVSLPAQAYTPESGTWWNPNESGTGIFIEVQDNFLVAAVFTGDAQGRPVWYTATKFLTGNALFDATLDLTTNVQCPGCSYPGPGTTQTGAGGTIRLTFNPDDPTRATLRWGNGRTVPFERYAFYAKRPEDASSVPVEVTKMLGEWQNVMDFSASTTSSFDYYGDVLVFDEYRFRNGRWYFEGCRADNSQVGGCSNNALSFHSAAGYYDASSGLHATVVDDSAANYVLYLADMGTNSAEGEITVYPKGGNPSNYASYPIRTFRTASRTFVQEGVGPSMLQAKAAAPTRGLSDQLAAAGVDLTASPKAGTASRFDRAALQVHIAALEDAIEARKAAR